MRPYHRTIRTRHAARLSLLETRVLYLEKQMNTQEKTLADAITPLLAQITVFADKFDTLTETVAATNETAQSAQAEIDAALQAILQRTSPVPDVDVADLVNQISFASKRVTGEIAMAGTATDEINQHSQQLKTFADDVQSKADAPSTDPSPSTDPPAETPPSASTPGASGILQSSAVPAAVTIPAPEAPKTDANLPAPVVVTEPVGDVSPDMAPVQPIDAGTGLPLADTPAGKSGK
jgi:uncharacterized coiled-coil protein SlyX